MKHQVLALSCILFTTGSAVAQPSISNPWSDRDYSEGLKAKTSDRNAAYTSARHLTVDPLAFIRELQDDEHVSFMLPLPDGEMATYLFKRSSVIAPELAARYPNLLTFEAYEEDNPTNSGRFDLTNHGFHGMFQHDGKKILIDPESRNNATHYISYYAKNAKPLTTFAGDTYFKATLNQLAPKDVPTSRPATGNSLKTYRMAISATNEYTAFHGGTKAGALSAMVTLVNRLNEVYQKDMSIRFELVANNDNVIFTDASSDPFSNNDNDVDTNAAVQSALIGNANFDIGHVLNTQGGGLAYPGICNSTYKARGLTGSPFPTGDFFYISLVAHEVGHQLGADHTFNGSSGACADNREASTAWEPGSGSTIMSYAGICADEDIASESDSYFHAGSIEQMLNFTSLASCGITFANGNSIPIANAGLDYIVPANTPLILTGSATDINNSNTLTYNWEQMDIGSSSNSPSSMSDNGNRPIFRSWEPSNNPVRYLPRLSDVLSGKTVLGESYAKTNRDLNFRFTVRDNLGGVAYDDMKVSVTTSAGPFSIHEPVSGEQWKSDTSNRVQWNVAGTNQAPVSCENVDILLSEDDGSSFFNLLINTPNDGETFVKTPNRITNKARLMVRCSNNIFYAVNDGKFSITPTATVTSITPSITSQQSLIIDENTQLSLSLNHLTVNDADSIYPADFSLLVATGSNYSVSGVTIIPDDNYSGTLTVPVRVNDGQNTSAFFNLIITVKKTNIASTNNGGATGAISPWMLLLLLGTALVSAGCKKAAHSAEKEDPTGPLIINEESEPVKDAHTAIEMGDYRLLMLSGRLPLMPGVNTGNIKDWQEECGIRYLGGTGDVVKSDDESKQRRRKVSYATEYNQIILEYCKRDKNN